MAARKPKLTPALTGPAIDQNQIQTGPRTMSKERTEKAWKATQRFRRMIPALNSFARALTRNNEIAVVMHPQMGESGGAATDGHKVYMMPPLSLGEDVSHDRSICDQRDEDDQLLCPACAQREDTLIIIFHELAHIVSDSFVTVDDATRAQLIKRAVEMEGSKFGKHAQRALDTAPQYIRESYAAISNMVSPFFPMLINCLEDARVNRAMWNSRPGTKPMFDAWNKRILNKGIEQPDGTLARWYDRPRNSQSLIALYAKASGYDVTGWFIPEIELMLQDKELNMLLFKLQTVRSIKGTYELAFPILTRLRQLGFCRSPEDNDVDADEMEPQPQPEGESDDEPSEEQGDGEPDQQDTGGSSDDDGDSGDDESAESEAGDGPVAGGSEPDSGAETSDEGEPDDTESNGSGDSEPDGDSDDGGGWQGDEDDGNDSDVGSDTDAGDADGDESGGQGGTGGSSVPGDDGDAEGSDELDSADGSGGELSTDGDDDEAGASKSGTSGEADGSAGVDDDTTGADFDDPTAGGAGGEYKNTPSQHEDSQTADDLGDYDGDPYEGTHQGTGDVDGPPIPPEDDADDLDDGAGSSGPRESQDGDEAISAPDLEFHGSAEEAGRDLAEFGGHGEHTPTREEKDEAIEVARAIIQSGYFESPSQHVLGVRVHEFDKHYIETDGRDASEGWAHNTPYMRGYSRMELGIDVPTKVAESYLGKALMRTRVAFDMNRQHKRLNSLKTGRINGRTLARRAPVGDERLFYKKTRPGKRDYFVILGIDISGSTAGENIQLAKTAAMAQAELLTRVGVQFEVWAHTADTPKLYDMSGMLMLDMYQVKTLDEPWDDKRRHRLAELAPCAGNLDGHSLEFYRKRAEKSRATDKVILYYTDGAMPASNYDEELDILQRELAVCKRQDIEVMGVGIRTDSPTRHGLDTVRIDELTELEKVVHHLEKKLAVRA